MSYEKKMLIDYNMPTKHKVKKILLKKLLQHNGTIKEFNTREEIVAEIADEFELTARQRNAYLETIYKKENRVKKSNLWNRLLFRAADTLANEKMVIRPTETLRLTNKKEWMLTEDGIEYALKLSKSPDGEKEKIHLKSFELQKLVKKMGNTPRPKEYNPMNKQKSLTQITKQSLLRKRAFRQSVIFAYDFKCSICGLKINTPGSSNIWEVEAAHIVPHSSKGKDDIWNGIALCHLHHWAFDVGWITLLNDYKIKVSHSINSLPSSYGKISNYDFLSDLMNSSRSLLFPKFDDQYPHQNSIQWHRQNIFHQ